MSGAFAVFASGTGSNAMALADAVEQGQIPARLACVVCDQPAAPVIVRARDRELEVLEYDVASFADRAAYEQRVVSDLRERAVEHIVLAGYMRICGPVLLAAYGDGAMINVHPSLLPDFPGRDAIGDALAAGVSRTGVTVHFVDEGIDTGPVIVQRVVPIRADDDRAALAARVHRAEHVLLPAVTAELVSGRLWLAGDGTVGHHDLHAIASIPSLEVPVP